MKRRSLLQAGLAGLLLFALAIASQFVAATYGAGVRAPPVQLAQVPKDDRPHLRIVDGVPVAYLSGTPYEMGRQHGSIFKQQIHFLFHEYFEALAVPAVGREELRRWAKKSEPFIPAHLRDELHGLAAGAGMAYADVLMVNTMVDRLQSVMCSTVVASGEASRNGEVYFGRNLDFPGRNFLHRSTVVLVFEPENGPRLVSVTWPGLIGVLSGMNERGVAGATMMIHRGKRIRAGMPYMIMYREALSAAHKTPDVYDYIAAAKRTCPNNFMVVDATGAAEVVEYDQEVVARRAPERGCLCSTNYFRTKDLRATGWPLGTGRYRTLDEFLTRTRGRVDLESVKQALRDVAKPWFLNVQSMIFLPARRSLHLAVPESLPAASGRWVQLERGLLFRHKR